MMDMPTTNMPIMRPVPFDKDAGLLETICTYTRDWELMEDWEIFVPSVGVILIPVGFIFDGASIPKMLRWILSPVGILLIPGLVHDFCYHNHFINVHADDVRQWDVSKDDADELFLEIADQETGLPFINQVAYQSVKYFGGKAWNDGGK